MKEGAVGLPLSHERAEAYNVDVETGRMDIIKKTYDEIQAALLNSEREPQQEIFTALCVIAEFADGEGLTEVQTRALFEKALVHPRA